MQGQWILYVQKAEKKIVCLVDSFGGSELTGQTFLFQMQGSQMRKACDATIEGQRESSDIFYLWANNICWLSFFMLIQCY